MSSIDKSLTKKLLDDVIVKKDEKKDDYPKYGFDDDLDSGVGSGSWMDDWDRANGWSGGYSRQNAYIDDGRAFGLGQTARGVVDSNRSNGNAIELDRHDTDEVVKLLSKKIEKVLSEEGFVMTTDSRDELEGSVLAVVDLCKWKSGTNLYVLKLR